MKTVEEDIKLDNQNHYKLKMDIGISTDGREDVASGLSQALANTYALMIKTHNYHWNIKGKNFHQIHLLTEELFSAIDEIAERIRSLGFVAPGSFKEFAELSDLKDPKRDATENEMLADLLESHEQIAKSGKALISKANKNSDEATADLITERISVHEKYAWMLRSMLEE